MKPLYLSHWKDGKEVYVHQNLVKKLKNYQIYAIRFLYDCYRKKARRLVLHNREFYKMKPLYLSHWKDGKEVYVHQNLVKKLKNYQIYAIRFLYDCYRKKRRGSILNYDDNMNCPLTVQAFLSAIYQSEKLETPALVLVTDENLCMWHYHLKQIGVEVVILTEKNSKTIWKAERFVVILSSFTHLKLVQPHRENEFSFVIVDQFDMVATKLIFKKLTGNFNVGITTKDFINERDQKIFWSMLNWSNPGLFGNLSAFYKTDSEHLMCLRDPYADVWLRLKWNFSDDFVQNSLQEQEEYRETLKTWAKENNIKRESLPKTETRKRNLQHPENSPKNKRRSKRKDNCDSEYVKSQLFVGESLVMNVTQTETNDTTEDISQKCVNETKNGFIRNQTKVYKNTLENQLKVVKENMFQQNETEVEKEGNRVTSNEAQNNLKAVPCDNISDKMNIRKSNRIKNIKKNSKWTSHKCEYTEKLVTSKNSSESHDATDTVVISCCRQERKRAEHIVDVRCQTVIKNDKKQNETLIVKRAEDQVYNKTKKWSLDFNKEVTKTSNKRKYYDFRSKMATELPEGDISLNQKETSFGNATGSIKSEVSEITPKKLCNSPLNENKTPSEKQLNENKAKKNLNLLLKKSGGNKSNGLTESQVDKNYAQSKPSFSKDVTLGNVFVSKNHQANKNGEYEKKAISKKICDRMLSIFNEDDAINGEIMDIKTFTHQNKGKNNLESVSVCHVNKNKYLPTDDMFSKQVSRNSIELVDKQKRISENKVDTCSNFDKESVVGNCNKRTYKDISTKNNKIIKNIKSTTFYEDSHTESVNCNSTYPAMSERHNFIVESAQEDDNPILTAIIKGSPIKEVTRKYISEEPTTEDENSILLSILEGKFTSSLTLKENEEKPTENKDVLQNKKLKLNNTLGYTSKEGNTFKTNEDRNVGTSKFVRYDSKSLLMSLYGDEAEYIEDICEEKKHITDKYNNVSSQDVCNLNKDISSNVCCKKVSAKNLSAFTPLNDKTSSLQVSVCVKQTENLDVLSNSVLESSNSSKQQNMKEKELSQVCTSLLDVTHTDTVSKNETDLLQEFFSYDEKLDVYDSSTSTMENICKLSESQRNALINSLFGEG